MQNTPVLKLYISTYYNPLELVILSYSKSFTLKSRLVTSTLHAFNNIENDSNAISRARWFDFCFTSQAGEVNTFRKNRADTPSW